MGDHSLLVPVNSTNTVLLVANQLAFLVGDNCDTQIVHGINAPIIGSSCKLGGLFNVASPILATSFRHLELWIQKLMDPQNTAR